MVKALHDDLIHLVRMAAVFHDIVYDTKAPPPRNEIESADMLKTFAVETHMVSLFSRSSLSVCEYLARTACLFMYSVCSSMVCSEQDSAYSKEVKVVYDMIVSTYNHMVPDNTPTEYIQAFQYLNDMDLGVLARDQAGQFKVHFDPHMLVFCPGCG